MGTGDYTDILNAISAQLQQLSTDITHAVCVIAALVGVIIGFWAAKELLSIWL